MEIPRDNEAAPDDIIEPSYSWKQRMGIAGRFLVFAVMANRSFKVPREWYMPRDAIAASQPVEPIQPPELFSPEASEA